MTFDRKAALAQAAELLKAVKEGRHQKLAKAHAEVQAWLLELSASDLAEMATDLGFEGPVLLPELADAYMRLLYGTTLKEERDRLLKEALADDHSEAWAEMARILVEPIMSRVYTRVPEERDLLAEQFEEPPKFEGVEIDYDTMTGKKGSE